MARELAESAVTLKVTLVEATPQVLNGFSAHSSQTALADLGRRGVYVRLGQTVRAADAQQVTLSSGEHIQTSTVIWAAGVKANSLGRGLGLEVNDHGRSWWTPGSRSPIIPMCSPSATWLRPPSRHPGGCCQCSPRWPSKPVGTPASRSPG